MDNRGFTLVEVLVTISIMMIIGGLGLVFGLDSLRSYAFRSDRDLLVSALQYSRATAMGNMCRNNTDSSCVGGRSHGVHLADSSITLFQTSSAASDYSSRDASADLVLPLSPATVLSGVTDVVFAQLSGDVAVPGEMTLTSVGGRSSKITIGSEGQIEWTN